MSTGRQLLGVQAPPAGRYLLGLVVMLGGVVRISPCDGLSYCGCLLWTSLLIHGFILLQHGHSEVCCFQVFPLLMMMWRRKGKAVKYGQS
jgi:hypothetical protein